MWKIFLTFVVHRVVLFVIAAVAINQYLVKHAPPESAGKTTYSLKQILRAGLDQVSQASEFKQLNVLATVAPSQVFQATSNSFLWICRWIMGLFSTSPWLTLLVASNLFFFLFLWELHTLLSRMVSKDIAFLTTALITVWPTSYELNLGSTMAMTCCLTTLVLRHALDNQWLVSGISMGLLAFVEPLSVGLVPLALFLFWYYQRHFPMTLVARRSAYFLFPLALGVLLRLDLYQALPRALASSPLSHLMDGHLGAAHSKMGYLLTVIAFVGGGIAAAVSNSGLVHRVVPAYMAALLLLFSTSGSLASRAPIAAISLQGVSLVSSKVVTRWVHGLVWVLGFYQVYSAFA